MQPGYSKDYAVKAQLTEARQHLDRAKSLLLSENPSCAEGAAAALETIRGSLQAFLTWHGLNLPEDTPLSTLGSSAIVLARSLETFIHLALPVERLVEELRDKKHLNVNDREAAQAAYYTARNLLSAVAGELPVHLYPSSNPYNLQDQVV